MAPIITRKMDFLAFFIFYSLLVYYQVYYMYYLSTLHRRGLSAFRLFWSANSVHN